MGERNNHSEADANNQGNGDRLDSWKEIAAYLKHDVRTVQRWEAEEGLPVYRHPTKKRATVYAYRSELDAWWAQTFSTGENGPNGQNGRLRRGGSDRRLAPDGAQAGRLQALVARLGSRGLVLAAVVAVAVAVALADLARGRLGSRLFAPGQPAERQIAELRLDFGGRVSPDGQWLAYRHDETAHLWLLHFQSGEKRLLVPDWIGSAIAWSRDSRRLAFVKLGDPPRRLETVNIHTEERQVILEDPPERPTPWDWTADGYRLLVTVRVPNNKDQRRIAFLSLADGAFTPIRAAPRGIHQLRLSPDERFVAYQRRRDIYLIPVQLDTPAVLLSDHPDPEIYPFWAPDGQAVYFVRRTKAQGPNKSLWRVEIDDLSGAPIGEPFHLLPLGNQTLRLRPSVSHQGDIFITRQTKPSGGVHLLEMDPATGMPLGEPKSNFPPNSNPNHWSRDGKRLAYMHGGLSARLPEQHFFYRNLSTGEETIAPVRPVKIEPEPRWYSMSADKRLLAYAYGDRNVIYLRDVEAGTTQRREDPSQYLASTRAVTAPSSLSATRVCAKCREPAA